VAVRIELLGDVRAYAGDAPIDIGHIRQRCVLAVLALEAGRPVPVDQLVDRSCADGGAQRARAVIYTYVSRLRRLLADAGGRLARTPGGYLLEVDPDAIDAHRFVGLVARSRLAADALPQLDEALALWRGDALAGLDTPWLNAARDDLERRRLAAELARNDLALDRDEPGRLLPGLEQAVLRHPLNERLTGQLMTALYRDGRQADALDRFRVLHRRLAEEVGTEPGAELADLHRRILRREPAPAATGPAREPATRPAPRQLPAAAAGFVGREPEIAALDALLDDSTMPIAAICGTAGVGKTTLALHWGHRVRDRFPDGQIHVDLRGFDPRGGAMDPAEVLRGFLHALGVPPRQFPAGLEACAALFRTLLDDRRMLVVLDNARDAGQVRALLPGSPGSFVVVTSRNPLLPLVATHGARVVGLDLLTTADARRLLTARLGASRLAGEPEAADAIIERCARLPLALSIAAARAATAPRAGLAGLAADLREAERLDTLAAGDASSDVRAVLSASYRLLSAPAARLFRLLGLLPGPDVGRSAAAGLAGLTDAEVRPLLAELTAGHLAEEPAARRFSSHDLLRAYAAERAAAEEDDADRRAAVRRVLDHYLHTAYAADRRLNPHRHPIELAPPAPGIHPEPIEDERQAADWFAAERAVLIGMITMAARERWDGHAWRLAWCMVSWFDRRGRWDDWSGTQQVALAAAARSADPVGRAHAHLAFGRTRLWLEKHDDARHHLGEALDLFARLADPAGAARTHLALARLTENQGRHEDAASHASRAADLYRSAGHRDGEARARNILGWQHALLGRYETALEHGERALDLLTGLDDRRAEAGTRDTIAYARHHLGDPHRAIEGFLDAIRHWRASGDLYNEATSLAHLGDAYRQAGDLASARQAWGRALSVLERLGHSDAAAVRARIGPFLRDGRAP
jgi:DNA-binding SARP family transcriptional activator